MVVNLSPRAEYMAGSTDKRSVTKRRSEVQESSVVILCQVNLVHDTIM